MSTAEQVRVDVREVTSEEVGEYTQNGWAGLLPRLISPETAADLLAIVKEKIGERDERDEHAGPIARNLMAFAKWYRLERGVRRCSTRCATTRQLGQ